MFRRLVEYSQHLSDVVAHVRGFDERSPDWLNKNQRVGMQTLCATVLFSLVCHLTDIFSVKEMIRSAFPRHGEIMKALCAPQSSSLA